MKQHRTALRWLCGLLMAGVISVAGMAPAQADTAWNGTVMPHQKTHVHMRPADSSWNGT